MLLVLSHTNLRECTDGPGHGQVSWELYRFVGGGGYDRKKGQIFIWPKEKPNWEDSHIGISTLMLCMCSCLNFFRNNYTWLHFVLQFIQMENIKNGDVMSPFKISAHFLLQPMGQRELWKKGHSSCLCLISALIGFRPMLLQLIYFRL